MRLKHLFAGVLLALLSLTAADAGLVTQSGTRLFSAGGGGGGGAAITHGSTFTITGSGFGTKSGLVNVSDNGDHGQAITVRWTGAWPSSLTSGNAVGNAQYQTVPFVRSIGTSAPTINHPTGRQSHIISAAAIGGTADSAGWNCGVWKSFTKPAGDYYIFAEWYEYVDDQWAPQSGSAPHDGNFKWFDFSSGTGPYNENWYAANWFGSSCGVSCFYSGLDGNDGNSLNDDTIGSGLVFPDADSHGQLYGGDGARKGVWQKRTAYLFMAASPNGRVQIYEYENQANAISYRGKTADTFSGTARTVLLGGYNRAYPVNENWRYFANLKIEVDDTDGQIFLTNNNSWSASTIRVKQPYTSWSSTSITVTADAGLLSAGTVYVHFRLSPWQTQGNTALESRTLN